jgi:hypothetical protein
MNLTKYTLQFSEKTAVERLREAEKNTERHPTQAQIKAENYKKGKLNLDGMKISIENPRGSVRKGTDPDGKKWSIKMKTAYGYINGIKGADGDNIDIMLSKDPSKGKVFIVDQIKPGTQKFDEHKIMYGFENKADAVKAYKSNYQRGWKGMGGVTGVTKEQFKNWLKQSPKKIKPFELYKNK